MAITAAALNVAINVKGAKDAERQIAGVGDAVDQAESKSKRLGGGLLGLGGIVAGVFAGGATAAISFGEEMANVNSIAQLTTNELAAVSDEVLNIATASGQGPEVLAQGLYDIYSSGFKGAEGLQLLEISATAANAGLTTTAVSADALTSVLNAYDMTVADAAHVSDVLFNTVDAGKITFEELSANMGNVLPVAAALGVSFEELAAGYAQMTISGVPAAQAETQMAALMRSALNPTEALTAATIAYGYATPEALISAEGFVGYLTMLTQASGGSSEALFDLVGTQEAMNAVLLLGGENLADYTANVEMMEKSSEGLGATQTALNKQMESTAFSLRLLKTNIQAGAIAIGVQLEPAISAIAKGMTAAIKVFLNLSKPVQQIIGYVTALVGVVAGAAGAWIVFGSTITGVISLLASLALPILAIVAAVAGLYLAWETNFLGIQDITRSAVDAITGFLEPVTDFLGRFKDAWDATAPPSDVMSQINAWGGIVTEEMTLAERAINALDVATGGLVTGLREMTAVDIAVAIGSWVFSTAVDLASALGSWLLDQAVNLVHNIPSIAVSISDWVISSATSLWNRVKEWITGGGADNGMSGDGTGGASPASSISIGDVAVVIGGWIVSAATSLWDAVKSWSFGGGGGSGGDPTGMTGGGAAAQGITIESILVNIGEWAQGTLPDIGLNILTWVTEQITAIDFTGIGLTLKNSFFTAMGAAFSIGEGIGGLLGGAIDLGAQILDWVTQQIEGVDWNSAGSSFATLLGAGIAGTVIAFPTLTGKLLGGILNALVDVDWGAVGSSFLQLWVAFVTGVGDFFVGFATKIGSELLDVLPDVDWGAIGGVIREGFVTAVAGVGGAIAAAIWGELPGWLTTLIEGGVSGLLKGEDTTGVEENIAGTFQPANLPPSSMDVGAIGQLQGIGMLGSAYQTLVLEAQNAAKALADTVGSIMSVNLVATGAITSVSGLGEASRGAADGMKAAFSTPIDTSILTSSFLGLKDTIATSMAEVGTAITTGLSGAMQTAVVQTQGMGIGSALTTGIAAGIRLGAATVSSAITSLVTTAGNSRAGMMIAGLGSGGAFATGTSAGIRLGSGGVGSAVAALVATASGYRASMMVAGLSIGIALGQGIAAGIRSQIGAVAAAAAALVTTAIAAAKLAGAVSSPSRIMDEQVGQMLGLGAALGVERMYPRMADAMAGLIDVPTVPLQAGGGLRGTSFTSPVSNGGGGQVTHNTPVTVNVTVQGSVTTESELTEHITYQITGALTEAIIRNRISAGVLPY